MTQSQTSSHTAVTSTNAEIPEGTTFEQAFRELEQIVSRLEAGDLVPLADAVDLYERGIALKSYCDKILADAKMRIDKVVNATPAGEIETEAFAPRA